MKKMDKQTALAGILGIIALVSIVVQLVSGGISTSSVAGAVKDLTGIAIDVLVFVLAIRIAAKKSVIEEPLEARLQNALDQWRDSHANMISSEVVARKTDGKKYRFKMKTDLKNYFDDPEAGARSGEFMTISEIGSPDFTEETFKITFALNVSTFFEEKVDDEVKKHTFETISRMIVQKLKEENGVVNATCKANGGNAEDEPEDAKGPFVWELTEYRGTGEGYFPLAGKELIDGLFRRYEPAGQPLPDSCRGWVEYTFSTDETGIVIFENAGGVQNRAAEESL